MITLYRSPDNDLGKQVEEKLRDIVIAHNVIIVRSKKELPFKDDDCFLPVLVDDNEHIYGEKSLYSHLEYLGKLMADWDRFQSDACYIDKDGTIC
jgi:hypothetical protein